MIEYEKINLNPQTEKKPCGCKETKKDCSCNKKIDIKSNCATPQCFKVDNYFSELVHNWEKEAARYNLGIQELEGIEYVTENKDDELLTKVIFKYRQGHELITREFYCAPAGPEGKPGKDGRDGDTGPQGLKGDKGDTPTLNKVILTWVNNCDDEGGRFIEDCLNNGYNLELKLKRPDVFEELSKILDLINEQLTQFYAKKSDLIDYVKNATFTNTITDILNRLSTAGAEYRLVYNAPWLYLTKDGKNVSSVKVEGGTSSGNSYYFTGSVFVYQIFPINYSEIPDIKKIVGSNWENMGWQKSLPDRENENNEAVWMATCNVESGSYGTWSYTKLTGANGIDGVDSDNLEFVYYRTVNSYIPSNKMPHITDPSADKPVPSDSDWLDHPLGVTEDVPYEFYSFSKKENDRWSEFVLPMIWSHYGRNGHDGDGVEYIFKTVNLVNTLINPTPINITYALYQKSEYVPSDWSDNPNSSLTSGQYLYVCQRTYRKVTQAHVNKYSEYGLTSEHIDSYMWLPFSDPAIWNYYAKDGEGSQGLAGAVIRTRGEWKAGQPYYRNCAEIEGGIKYIDIVLYDGEYYIVSLEQDGKSFISCDTWECDKEHWTKATGFDFIATRALKADNAEINYLDTNEVRIWDSKTKTAEHLVAGMTSGQNLDDTDPIKGNTTGVRIWAGKTKVDNNVDLNIAPFRVYSDGKVVANDVWYEQLKIDENYIISAEDVVKLNHRIKYLCTTDKTPYIEVKGDQNSLQIINADSQRVSKYTCKQNSMYAIVGLTNNLIGVYELSDPNPKEITPSYSGYTTIEYGNDLNLGDLKISSRPDESKIDSGAIDVEFNEPATIKINVVSGENVYVYTPITFECEIEDNGTQNEQIVNALPNCRLRGYGFILGNTSDNNFTIQDLELELDVSTIPVELNPFKNQQGYPVKFRVSNVIKVDIELILYKYNIVVNNVMSSGAMISDGRIVGELINGTVTNYENVPIIYSEQQGNSTVYRVVLKKVNSISTESLPSYSDLQEAKVNAYVQEAQPLNP